MYTTGNPICDDMRNIHIQGNIVPRAWFKTIIKTDLKSPKPHLLAISILSDIVYWYRPSEVRDELTGELKQYKKKFAGDLLQRSYKSLADMYGCSKDTAKEAIVFLEELGVIYRVIENESVGDLQLSNVMYLGLNVERLKELTYPGEISTEGGAKTAQTGEKISAPLACKISQTNTGEKPTEISAQTTRSIHPIVSDSGLESSGLSEETIAEEVKNELSASMKVPYAYQRDEKKMLAAVRYLADWDNVCRDHFSSDLAYQCYRTSVDCLTDMACASTPCTYNKHTVSSGKDVIARINACLAEDRTLWYVLQEAIDDYISGAAKNKINNINGYVKAVIWTSLCSYRIKAETRDAFCFDHHLFGRASGILK